MTSSYHFLDSRVLTVIISRRSVSSKQSFTVVCEGGAYVRNLHRPWQNKWGFTEQPCGTETVHDFPTCDLCSQRFSGTHCSPAAFSKKCVSRSPSFTCWVFHVSCYIHWTVLSLHMGFLLARNFRGLLHPLHLFSILTWNTVLVNRISKEVNCLQCSFLLSAAHFLFPFLGFGDLVPLGFLQAHYPLLHLFAAFCLSAQPLAAGRPQVLDFSLCLRPSSL